MAFRDFDPAQYDEPVEFKVIPDGENKFVVTSSEMKYWNEEKTEGTLSFKLTCLHPEFNDKYLFASFNVVNPDTDKEKKALTNLATFTKACGHVGRFRNPEQPVELNNKVLLATVQEYNSKKCFLPWGYKSIAPSASKPSTPPTSGATSAQSGGGTYQDDVPF